MGISEVTIPSAASIVKGESGKTAVRNGVLVHRGCRPPHPASIGKRSSYMPEVAAERNVGGRECRHPDKLGAGRARQGSALRCFGGRVAVPCGRNFRCTTPWR